jgi:hypothetical protein
VLLSLRDNSHRDFLGRTLNKLFCVASNSLAEIMRKISAEKR